MPLISEPTKFETPAAGLDARLSPQRLRNEKIDDSVAQTEPDRHLLTQGKLISGDKECDKCEGEGPTTNASQHTALDSVKQSLNAIPEMASNAAHTTAEFVKHIPEHAQHGANATAEFVKHIPEHAQHGAHATAEFMKGIPEHAQHGAHATAEFVKGIHVPETVQHGFSATTDFVRNIPENVQHGAHATADFVKHLPEQAKGALHLGGSTQKDAPTLNVTPAEAGVPADDQKFQRAAPPASPYEYKTPTSLEKSDYMRNINRSDDEGMHVHRACGACKQGYVHQGAEVQSPLSP